jgi:uncharacterized iron-regulated membrane protein
MFRKILFWSHLACGVTAGLVILMMSFTGVLLTYERQILAWVERSDYVSPAEQTDRHTLEQLHFIARTEHGDFTPAAIVVTNDPGAPVTFSAGRSGGFSLNPYTGEEMEVGSPGLENFFSITTGIHRWFNLSGDSRNTARAITGASNLMFLFIIFSGLYLWFPKLWRWSMFRIRLAFRNSAGNSKARDFNWHHVFGIWSAIPLAVVVATASVFYYPWANNLVYQVYGEEPPGRGGPAPAAVNQSGRDSAGSLPGAEPVYQTLDALFASAAEYVESGDGYWRQISLTIPRENSDTVSFAIDQGNGGQPHLRHTLVLGRESGQVAQWQPFSSQTPGRQTRSIVRFLHTGEALGLWGQTIAGLVSFTSLLMVWTGLALAWRRLIVPLYRKRAVARH